jgi:hypothetical protein
MQQHTVHEVTLQRIITDIARTRTHIHAETLKQLTVLYIVSVFLNMTTQGTFEWRTAKIWWTCATKENVCLSPLNKQSYALQNLSDMICRNWNVFLAWQKDPVLSYHCCCFVLFFQVLIQLWNKLLFSAHSYYFVTCISRASYWPCSASVAVHAWAVPQKHVYNKENIRTLLHTCSSMSAYPPFRMNAHTGRAETEFPFPLRGRHPFL